MEKYIEIDGRKIKFKATAATPRIYRIKFRSDLMVDLNRLAKASVNNDFSVPDLELFENVAYIMARQADDSIPDNVIDWLDDFSTFAIRDILPGILELWKANTETQIESKKNLKKAIGK